MVNREMRKVTLVSYKPGADQYGQQMQVPNQEKEIEMTFGLYTHTESEGPQYQDVNYYGLTREKGIADNQTVRIDDKDYKILFVNPFGRLTQVFMQ